VNPLAANRLAKICSHSADAPEWEEFVRMASPVVSLAARRLGELWGDRSTVTVNEIVQEVFLKLCEDDRRVLREFEERGDDSFLRLLRVITATVGTDHFRRTTAEKRGGSAPVILVQPHAVAEELHDSQAARAMEMPSLFAQLDGLLRLYPNKVSARDRKLFWLHYGQGLSAKAISRIPAMGLSPKGVESALIRLTRLLKYTVAKGKPKLAAAKNKSSPAKKIKGFSSPVTINNIENR
jgi:RNA polymerase sigma-70 factor (ECF subfamily)